MKHISNPDKAYVILHGSNHIATVLSSTSKAGVCRVTVAQFDSAAIARTVEFFRNSRKAPKKLSGIQVDSLFDSMARFQTSTTGGFGYDKFAVALRGLVIDGVEMTDHCQGRLPYPEGFNYFPLGFKPPAGYRTANSVRNDSSDATKGFKGHADCYREAGLEFLRATGYTVLTVL